MVDFAGLLQHVEDRQNRPGAEVDMRRETIGDHTRDVLDEATAGDVRDALDHAGFEQRGQRLDIDLGGGEQHVAELLTAELIQLGVDGVSGLFEQGLAHQGEAIGMHAGGGKADQHVAFDNRGTIDYGGLLGHAHGETGQIVLVLVVHARHLGGLAADQAAIGLHAAVGHAGDDLLKQGRIVLAAGDVIQEEQRLGALGGDIVDAHGHAVDADGVVLVGHLGHDQLGADAVGAGNQHWLLVTQGGEIEQAAESADAADHARTVGARHVGLDTLDDFVTGLNAYAGFLICFWHI